MGWGLEWGELTFETEAVVAFDEEGLGTGGDAGDAGGLVLGLGGGFNFDMAAG
jgi:hypothetical protein